MNASGDSLKARKAKESASADSAWRNEGRHERKSAWRLHAANFKTNIKRAAMTRKSKIIPKKISPFFFIIFIIASITLFLYASKCAKAETIFKKSAPTEEIFSRGKNLYEKQCSACHGSEGRGNGPAAYLLYPKPRDFSRNEFRLVSTTQMKATDEDLFKTISRGMPGSAMPPWGHLAENDRWALVYYVRFLAELTTFQKSGDIQLNQTDIPWNTVEKMLKKEIDPKALVEVTPEIERTVEGINRGKDLFIKACASCHGREGKGDGPQAMQDSSGYPVKPRDLTAGVFKADSSSPELYTRIIAGIPGSPMPSYNRVLSDEQIWDLIHYVQTLPQPGAEERSRLHPLQIEAARIKGKINLDPLSDQWSKIMPVSIVLTPLWWRNDRVESVEVRALHNEKEIAIHLSWSDPTEDNSAVTPQAFPDGVAIQFSTETDPPFFAMGNAMGMVTIWHWKALWQQDIKDRSDIETYYANAAVDWYMSQKNYEYGSSFEVKNSKTQFHDPRFLTGWGAGNPLSDPQRHSAAEEDHAKGLGTLTTQKPAIENVEAQGVWKDEKWRVVFHRSLTAQEKERLQFSTGSVVHIAFAVWDGAKRDRNGQKMVSIWNELTLK